MIFNTLKESRKNRKKIENRMKEFEKIIEGVQEESEDELVPNFFNSLVKMGWAKKPETEEEINTKKIQYEQKVKELEQVEVTKYENQVKSFEKQRRE